MEETLFSCSLSLQEYLEIQIKKKNLPVHKSRNRKPSSEAYSLFLQLQQTSAFVKSYFLLFSW